MEKSEWQLKFRNLPEIPHHKRWNGSNMTVEQIISNKLINKQSITNEEERIFMTLSTFYSELDKQLQILDYRSFDPTELVNFKNYIFYAFNYIAVFSNKLTIFFTYRMVVNEWVTNNNERIRNAKYLKYPSLEIVKKTEKFNRANSPETNIFYSTDNINAALKEIKPPVNKLLTVGVWKPKENKTFTSYPISHSEPAIMVNEGVARATKIFEEDTNNSSALLQNYMRYYFSLLGREFSKPIKHHYEYLISALFSERILSNRDQPNSDFQFDCIIYPSVGNNLKTDNVAILPEVLDRDFDLKKVIEFEVEEPYYDHSYLLDHPEKITIAKIRNYSATTNIDKSGNIKW